MTLPTQAEINKKKEDLLKLEKALTEEGKLPEAKLVQKLWTAIREVWMRAENKLYVLESGRTPDMNPNTRTKWLFKCEHCGEMFKLDDVEIDHKEGNHSFTKLSDFENYCDKILNASVHDLQILCKEDHAVKTYMEAHNLSWEQASLIKKAIKLEKEVSGSNKGKSQRQKKYLLSKGFKASEVNNEDNRRECFIKLVRGNK